jgi:hypothetical protein
VAPKIKRLCHPAKDYERRTDSSEAMVKVSAIGLMARRLAPAQSVARFNYRHAV